MALGTDVAIRLPGGPALPAHLALPETPGPFAGVVVLHESFGLNDDIRRITQRFARAGYAAVAPDLYGAGAKALCVARTILSLGRGKGYAFDVIEAARDYLGAQPAVARGRVAVAGFCLGGSFALLAAARGGYRAAAVQYGQVPRDEKALEGICPVVAGYGGKDRIFGPQAERLRRHLTVLGVPHDVKTYPDAGHSYMSQHEPTRIVRLGARGPMKVGYVPLAAEDSWRRILAFFGEHV
jgi:carboxymethylenebutenolidase